MPGDVLGADARLVMSYGDAAWARGLVGYTTAQELGATGPARWRVTELTRSHLNLAYASESGAWFGTWYTINLAQLVLWMGVPIGLGVLTCGAMGVVRVWRRRGERRLARGRCVTCGYELGVG